MTTEQQNTLVHLAAFRKVNGLLQQDVADYLDVSRGYISMVEKGASKLSRQNIDKLYRSVGTKHWDTKDLVPAHTRIIKAFGYYNNRYNEQRGGDGKEFKSFFIPSELADKIKYGELGIPEPLADNLIKVCPEISREWLLYGVGDMIIESHDETPNELEVLRKDIECLKANMISHDEMSRLLENMTTKILDAIKAKK